MTRVWERRGKVQGKSPGCKILSQAHMPNVRLRAGRVSVTDQGFILNRTRLIVVETYTFKKETILCDDQKQD